MKKLHLNNFDKQEAYDTISRALSILTSGEELSETDMLELERLDVRIDGEENDMFMLRSELEQVFYLIEKA